MNLKEIRQSLPDERIVDLMRQLGCEDFQDTPEAFIFPTICHNTNPSEASHKLYYYKSSKTFHCYTQCGDSFDIFELLKRHYELLGQPYDFFKDIVLKVAGDIKFTHETNFFEVYKSEFEKYKPKKVEINLTSINPSILNVFTEFYTPEWLQDGISIEAMRQFNILYSIPQNKIIIPHYDIDGNLIGIRGRALNPEDIAKGKYMPIAIGSKIYNHPLGYNLYGLNLNKDAISRKKTAFIFEAEKSVLMYETMFGRDRNIAVAACGSNISTYQFQFLRRLGVERIIIAFDKEGSTWAEKEKYHEKLKKLCHKNSNYCQMGYMFDKHNLLDLKESPTDRGLETFMKIYKDGVVYV